MYQYKVLIVFIISPAYLLPQSLWGPWLHFYSLHSFQSCVSYWFLRFSVAKTKQHFSPKPVSPTLHFLHLAATSPKSQSPRVTSPSHPPNTLCSKKSQRFLVDAGCSLHLNLSSPPHASVSFCATEIRSSFSSAASSLTNPAFRLSSDKSYLLTLFSR